MSLRSKTIISCDISSCRKKYIEHSGNKVWVARKAGKKGWIKVNIEMNCGHTKLMYLCPSCAETFKETLNDLSTH